MARASLPGLIVLALVAAISGCASRGEIEFSRPLPFHLAVVPATHSILSGPATGGDPDRGKPLSIRLDIATGALSRRIVDSLDGSGFVRASLLDYPDGMTAEEFARSYQPLQRWDYWSGRARELGADLLLTCNLEYDTRITSRSNDWFWINHLIFLFGGILSWFPDDRSYFVSGTLQADLHDASLIFSSPRSLGEPEAGILPLESSFDEVTLDFLGRASGVGTYALGVVLPSVWLATENETVEENLQAEILDAITADVQRAVRDRAREINEARPLVDFYFDLPTVRVAREQDGAITFRGEIILRTGRGVPRLRGFVLRCGDAEIQHDFTPESRVEDAALTEEMGQGEFLVYRYRIDERLVSTTPAEAVKAIVVQGGRTPARRSYTFPVERE